jgi:hypothetical protein
MVEINSTTKTLPLHIEVYPTAVSTLNLRLNPVLEIPDPSFYG